MNKTKIQLIAITLGCCLWAGCTTRTISYGGANYKSVRFANKEQIGTLRIINTNGVTIELTNFNSDQVQAIGAVAEGVAKGLAASVKP